jgi:glycerol 2-dehydrogenase (NADP+)
VIPKSITPSRIADNISKPLNVTLSAEEFARLDALAEGGKQQRFIKPPWPVVLGFEDWI